jgi:hypothetical protein
LSNPSPFTFPAGSAKIRVEPEEMEETGNEKGSVGTYGGCAAGGLRFLREEHGRVWRLRNREGGRADSLAKLPRF